MRAFLERNIENLEVLAINDLGDVQSNIHLYEYDSVHGRSSEKIEQEANKVKISDFKIEFLSEPSPEKLPWGDLDIDLVIESTGFFTERNKAENHIKAGAKKVLISAPAKNPDFTVVYGVNDSELSDDHKIISNASCTTNCLTIAFLMNESVGIETGYMTTVHSVTGDQNILIQSIKTQTCKKFFNFKIPTSTGAARAVGSVART